MIRVQIVISKGLRYQQLEYQKQEKEREEKNIYCGQNLENVVNDMNLQTEAAQWTSNGIRKNKKEIMARHMTVELLKTKIWRERWENKLILFHLANLWGEWQVTLTAKTEQTGWEQPQGGTQRFNKLLQSMEQEGQLEGLNGRSEVGAGHLSWTWVYSSFTRILVEGGVSWSRISLGKTLQPSNRGKLPLFLSGLLIDCGSNQGFSGQRKGGGEWGRAPWQKNQCAHSVCRVLKQFWDHQSLSFLNSNWFKTLFSHLNKHWLITEQT